MPLAAFPCAGGLKGSLVVPGDKSISHRALMLSTLTIGESRISGLLESQDVFATLRAMRLLGAAVRRDEEGVWHVAGAGIGSLFEPADVLDFGNAGTGVRLAVGLVGAHPLAVTITGDASLRRRPMARVLEPLRAAGVEIVARSGDLLPLAMRGPDLMAPLDYRVPVPSAQVKSALLLAALGARGTSRIVEPVPTRDHTERMLSAFGADINITPQAGGGCVIEVQGRPKLRAQDILVPGDPSSAAFPLVAALITPHSEVCVTAVLRNPARDGLYQTLREMGADIEMSNERQSGGETIIDITARHSALRGVAVPAERAPSMIDEYPVLAIAAAFAEGETLMKGLGELRVKECDRLAATADGLALNGVECEAGEDCLRVQGTGSVPGGACVTTRDDHRIAMSFLVLGLAAQQPVAIDDARMIATSFPDFVDRMHSLGAEISHAQNGGRQVAGTVR